MMAKKLLNLLFKVESTVAILCYSLIVLLLISDVALRELIGSSIPGAQRISVYMMIITGFLGMGLAASTGRHLRPRFADDLVSARLAGLAERVGAVIMTVILATYGVVAIRLVVDAYEYGDLARTIKIPLWTLMTVVPYAFFSTALRYAAFALHPELAPLQKISE
jgi:TRAP-type C4-dicarboxylate transport system permease small subunit